MLRIESTIRETFSSELCVVSIVDIVHKLACNEAAFFCVTIHTVFKLV